MQLLQSLLPVLTLLLLQGATVHGESSIPPPLQAVLTANSELLSALDGQNGYTDSNRSFIDGLQHVSGLARFTALAFSTAPLLDFIGSSPEESHPALEAIREVVGKINSSLGEATYLENYPNSSEVWKDYFKRCGNDDTNIRNAWVLLQNFLEKGPTVKTMEEKLRLAVEFTAFYAANDIEKTVGQMHGYITKARPGKRSSDILLNTICQNTFQDIYLVRRYSSYLSTLMVLGLQMKVYYHTLTGTGDITTAKAAMTQLSDVYLSLQNSQVECLNDFTSGAHMLIIQSLIKVISQVDYQRPLRELDEDHPVVIRLTDPQTALNIEEQLNTRYSFGNWTVVSITWRADDELSDGFNFAFCLPWSHICVYLKYAPRDLSLAKQPCTEELCPSQRGQCTTVKAFAGDICQCAQMFYGPKCGKSVEDDINQSLLGQGKTPIIVRKLTGPTRREARIRRHIWKKLNLFGKS